MPGTRGPPESPAQSQFTAVLYDAELALRPVSLRRCLRDLRRDPVTQLPLGPASAALRYLLPVYDLERNVPGDTGPLQRQIDELAEMPAELACHVTGSSIERLSVPPYTERQCELAAFRVADVDMMVEMKQLAVAPRRGAGRFYMDASRASHPGYTRVVLDADPQVLEPVAAIRAALFFKPVEEEGRQVLYLSLDVVNEHLAAEFQTAAPGLFIHRQGPAINVQETKRSDLGGAHSFVDDCDLVPALPLTEEPPEVGAWLARVEGRLWPPPDVREDIRRSGRCFRVGAGHASSERRDLEWRLSFSDLEKRLALSISPQQRKVYVLIKMMQKCYLQEPKVLVTYHIKTLMFWELETSSDIDWPEEELFEHLLAMLDRIQACLEQHRIPSYFIPDNNLISHASADDLAQVLATVRQIRRQPLQHLYGIDDRFRFDFSSPEPLSQLHAPLREAVVAGGGGAAEALVVSLIRQAQADVHRGLAEMPRCARLLRDAWEALAAAGAEGAPHPVHNDWLLFAAAAAFTSMQADESAWITMALRLELQKEGRPGTTKRLTEQEMAAAAALFSPVVGDASQDDGGVTQAFRQALEQTSASGVLEEQSPVFTVLTLRHAQLEFLRDVQNRNKENLTGAPPLANAITSTRLQLGIINLTHKFRLSCGVPEQVALAESAQAVLALAPSLGAASGRPAGVRSAVAGMVAGLGAPPDVTDRMHATVAPALDEFCERAQPAAASPARLPYEADPRVLSVIPLDMINTYIHTLGAGLSAQVVDHRYTPFFNMMGFFLKHRLYLYAFRTTGRMTCLRLSALEAELTRVVYNLHSAPLYLQQLSTPVRALLSLTTGRAAIGVLYFFIDFVHLTFDRPLMEELGLSPQEDFEKLEKMLTDAGACSAPDVTLTHLVMRLCVLKILQRDTADGLQGVADVGGESIAQSAGEILGRWDDVGDAPSPEVPSPEVPSPEVPSPEVPSPDVPSPEVPSHEVPSPEVPSPEVPSPEVPSPEVPSPKVPSPDGPSSDPSGEKQSADTAEEAPSAEPAPSGRWLGCSVV